MLPYYSDIAIIFEILAQIARIAAAVFLLALAFYLHVIASPLASESSRPAGHIVPFRFRWPPFVLGVLILDHARPSPLLPGDVLIVMIYFSFCYLLGHGFLLVLAYYGVERPRSRFKRYLSDIRCAIQGRRS